MPRTRITFVHLYFVCDALNEAAGTPKEGWITLPDGSRQAQVGHYYVEADLDGVKLVQIMNTTGGVREPLGSGYMTKRELYGQLHAVIFGIRVAEHRNQGLTSTLAEGTISP